jgi:hypothetical protein
MCESAQEDWSNLLKRATTVEQVTHVGEVAREQVQCYIRGHLLLSKRQVSLNSVGRACERFVSQVAQILHGGN